MTAENIRNSRMAKAVMYKSVPKPFLSNPGFPKKVIKKFTVSFVPYFFRILKPSPNLMETSVQGLIVWQDQ